MKTSGRRRPTSRKTAGVFSSRPRLPSGLGCSGWEVFKVFYTISPEDAKAVPDADDSPSVWILQRDKSHQGPKLLGKARIEINLSGMPGFFNRKSALSMGGSQIAGLTLSYPLCI